MHAILVGMGQQEAAAFYISPWELAPRFHSNRWGEIFTEGVACQI